VECPLNYNTQSHEKNGKKGDDDGQPLVEIVVKEHEKDDAHYDGED
jgi:hypothetical protein